MIAKPLVDVAKADIDALVVDAVSEALTIEYKGILPGNSDDQRREFLADVSSFANASGGDILYGVDEDQGVPTSANGLPGIDPDAEILRLESMIRSGIQPRVPGVQSIAIKGFPNGPVIVLRIPKSWSSPHMVTFKNLSRFFSRTSAGKYPLDVAEIRAAFLLSEAIPERIKRFRADRLSNVVAGETPMPMEGGAKMILHLFPVSSFSTATTVDVMSVATGKYHLRPLHASSWKGRMNLDGYVTYWPRAESDPCCSYSQLFRTGAIEAVDAFGLTRDRKKIPSIVYERDLIACTKDYLNLLGQLDIAPPIFLMLSMTGVKGFSMALGPEYFREGVPPVIDRDVLLLPEVVVEDLSGEPASILKPIFDSVWQSAGHLRSRNYDDQGRWAPPD